MDELSTRSVLSCGTTIEAVQLLSQSRFSSFSLAQS